MRKLLEQMAYPDHKPNKEGHYLTNHGIIFWDGNKWFVAISECKNVDWYMQPVELKEVKEVLEEVKAKMHKKFNDVVETSVNKAEAYLDVFKQTMEFMSDKIKEL